MALEISNGAGAQDCTGDIRCAGYHGGILLESQFLRDFFFNRAQYVNRTLEIGEFITGNAANPDEPVIVINFGQVAIIGYPVERN